MFFTACVLYNLSLVKLKTDDQALQIGNLTDKLQIETKFSLILG